MKVKIRETKAEDFQEIKNLLENQDLWADFPKETFIKMLERNQGCYLVAEANGKTVGNVFGSHDGGLSGYIYKLAVDQKFQRQKIASRLVRELLKRFKKAGIEWIYAHVHPNNKTSMAFFKTLGFDLRNDRLIIDNWKE